MLILQRNSEMMCEYQESRDSFNLNFFHVLLMYGLWRSQSCKQNPRGPALPAQARLKGSSCITAFHPGFQSQGNGLDFLLRIPWIKTEKNLPRRPTTGARGVGETSHEAHVHKWHPSPLCRFGPCKLKRAVLEPTGARPRGGCLHGCLRHSP